MTLLKASLERLAAEAGTARQKELQEACNSALARLEKQPIKDGEHDRDAESSRKDTSGVGSADPYWHPFKLALKPSNTSSKVKEVALDSIQKLVAYEYFIGKGPVSVIEGSAPENEKAPTSKPVPRFCALADLLAVERPFDFSQDAGAYRSDDDAKIDLEAAIQAEQQCIEQEKASFKTNPRNCLIDDMVMSICETFMAPQLDEVG